MVWVTGEVITAAKLNAMIDQAYPALQVLAAMDEATLVLLESVSNNYILYNSGALYDNHNDNSIDGAKWTIVTQDASGGVSTIEETASSYLRLYTYSSVNGTYSIAHIRSNAALTFPVFVYVTSSYNSVGTAQNTVNQLRLTGSTSGSISVAFSSYVDLTSFKITDNSGGSYTVKNLNTGTTVTDNLVGAIRIEYYSSSMWSSAGAGSCSAEIKVDVTGYASLTGNINSAAISSDAAVLAFFKHLKTLVSNGASTHATPVQAEIYGNADSYATPLNSTKFTIAPADPRIILKRDALDTITASSASQTVWNMTVAGGLPALPNHGSILATLIGVASVLVVEKSILGNWTDTVVLAENTDYVVDYSTRTATKIILTSGTGIVNAQSKIRISWIADVLKVGATNNTALKIKLYLNRTATSEASPSIQPLPLGTAKYAELQYCI